MDAPPTTYCSAIATMKESDRELHQAYHDNQYGFPIQEDDELFGRLILEINQAGLSWTTILKKQDSFRKAYDGFSIKRVAKYGDKERMRLLQDPGIIRNRLKIDAAIHNAQVLLTIQKTNGSFKNWLDNQPSMDRAGWTALFKKTFRFTGGEIVNEFLMSTGYLPGAHTEVCPIFKQIKKQRPAWMRSSR